MIWVSSVFPVCSRRKERKNFQPHNDVASCRRPGLSQPSNGRSGAPPAGNLERLNWRGPSCPPCSISRTDSSYSHCPIEPGGDQQHDHHGSHDGWRGSAFRGRFLRPLNQASIFAKAARVISRYTGKSNGGRSCHNFRNPQGEQNTPASFVRKLATFLLKSDCVFVSRRWYGCRD